MLVDAPDNALALRWLVWWQYGFWLQADESWRTQPLAALPAAVQRQYLRQHAAQWQRTLGIAPCPLPPPQPLVLAISELDVTRRAQLLERVAEICGNATGLPADVKIWLRRVAKGMRTERWLPTDLFTDGHNAGALLLLNALYPALWPRLRLLFPTHTVPAVSPPSLPEHRLRPLWEAALWQMQHHFGETRHVDT